MTHPHDSPHESLFSETYKEARARFRAHVQERQGDISSYALSVRSPTGEELTIDVGRIGPSDAERALIVSSGTHGVEGFFGSAVQLAALRRLTTHMIPPQIALIMIHAVNPFGFAHLRRVNEDNIDLNRNFIGADDVYKGADPGYVMMNTLLNPTTPPQRFDFFLGRALAAIARHGFTSLKSSIAQGQYEYPRGLFFGGQGPSESARVILENLPSWVGAAQQVTHLDLHTGLGKWGSYVIAGDRDLNEIAWERLAQTFGRAHVQSLHEEGVLYQIRGEFTAGCKRLFPHITYDPILAEFGTYPPLKVLAALRRENQATHVCASDDPRLRDARLHLKEMFAPARATWRRRVVQRGVHIVDQALSALG